jgi:acyl carrier protein
VLDRAMRPLPLGVPGELYLGGDGLARGYLGRPALTAERFLPDPCSGVPGARLYRTGDRVRWRADGVMEYFGRLDQQVKVRGHRVEPGEIEAVLRAHPAVRDAAVVPRDDGGERWLAAYAVAGDGDAADATALRDWCAGRLPAWMVPGAFTVLDALPLTASGKLDRRALPDPGGPAPAAEWEAPATETEREVAAVWREVLGVERVGATDDLFHLGGHSLKATRILTRIGVRFGVTLPVSVIFDHPTVRGLAARVDEQLARLRTDDEALLSWLESLSDEEAERMLADGGRA